MACWATGTRDAGGSAGALGPESADDAWNGVADITIWELALLQEGGRL